MQWKRFFKLACLAAVIVLFVGADTNQRFETLGHKMMCQCGCNQVLLECNHVGCTVSEQMRKELTAALTTAQLPGESQNSRQNNRAVAAAGTTTTGKARQQPIAVGVAASVRTEQMGEFRRRARQETEI